MSKNLPSFADMDISERLKDIKPDSTGAITLPNDLPVGSAFMILNRPSGVFIVQDWLLTKFKKG